MARTDNDTWDLASSVGATATMVAAARAVATAAADPLINDPFAEPLVRAVGVDFFTKLADGELIPPTWTTSASSRHEPDDRQHGGADPVLRRLLPRRAAAAGIRQAVILAVGPGLARLPAAVAGGHGGLRDRPARGDRVQDRGRWPSSAPTPTADRRDRRGRPARRLGRRAARRPGSTRTRRRRGAPRACSATCRRRPRTGCSTPSPSCRAPGSRIATECAPPSDADQEEQSRERMQAVSDQWREHGLRSRLRRTGLPR